MTHRVLLSGSGANTLSAFSTPCVRMHGADTERIPLLADERKRGADDLLSGKLNAGRHTILSLQHPLCNIRYIMDVLFCQQQTGSR